jgi:DNA polymerase-3 subunit epsilon
VTTTEIPTRQIAFDTETTGLPPDDEKQINEHRIIDLAFIEMIEFRETGSTFQSKFNPDRDVPESSTKIHGLTYAMLKEEPPFSRIAAKVVEFLAPAAPGGIVELIAHNAGFDMRFLREELERVNLEVPAHVKVVDTLSLARARYPRDGSHSVDALIRKLNLDPSPRAKFHGAMVDAAFLPAIYRHLCRKDEFTFGEVEEAVEVASAQIEIERQTWFPYRPPAGPTDEEDDAHYEAVKKLAINPWAVLFGETA